MKRTIAVVGCCTDSSAKLFVSTEHNLRTACATVRFLSSTRESGESMVVLRRAAPYWSGVTDIAWAPGATAIDYRIFIHELDEALSTNPDATGSFRPLPTDRPLRVAIVSCNGPEVLQDRTRWYERWVVLGEAIDAGEVDLILHAGDQIYADRILSDFNKTLNSRNPTGQDKQLLLRRYRREYFESWSQPEVARVLSRCPSLMMWDDHEIFDGYGSLEAGASPAAQACFGAASAAFYEYQLSHGAEQIDRGNSYAQAFIHCGTGVLMIDARSRRDFDQGVIVGGQQWDSIDEWLSRDATADLHRLFVVVGVPPVHSKVMALEWLIKTSGARRGDIDDLRDSWVSSANLDEGRRFILRLFNFKARHPQIEVLIVGGDVHVATLASIKSDLKAHQVEGRPLVIYQITSSGIGRPPPPSLLTALLSFTDSDIVFSSGGETKGRLLSFNQLPSRPRILATRNFAIVRQEDENGQWDRFGNVDVTFMTEDYGNVRVRLLGSLA